MSLLIYGANGYTGKLIIKEAIERDFYDIVIAGRNQEEITDMGEDFDVEYRIFSLDDIDIIVENLDKIDVVLHCAGPFSQTAEPMIKACLKSKTHYLDITGEIEIFELAYSYHDEAKHNEIIIMPGVGFDVVPTDCLSLKLHKEMPDAKSLNLAFYSPGGLGSQGTQKTTVEAMKFGGYIRENGELKQVPIIYDTIKVEFNKGNEKVERSCMTIPWGDVSTAYHTTEIPNIRVHMPVHPSRMKWLKLTRLIRPILGWGPVQKFMKWRIERGPKGPSVEKVETGETYIWGQVCKGVGENKKCFEIDMITPNGYAVTRDASLIISKKLLENTGKYKPGFHTPAGLFGEGLLNDLNGIRFP